MKITKHGPVGHALGAVLIFFAALGPAHAAASAPAAPVVHAAPQATLPLNDILRGEWDIALGRLADGTAYEPRIPYAATVNHAYAANLSHDENPQNGVTVSAVLTDPAGAAHTYPCWYGEDFTPSATPGQERAGPAPAGYAGWHLAFPCKAMGAWTGHLTVTDAGGASNSSNFAFTVAGALSIPDAAKGRLSVSTKDTKYVQYDDGDAYLPLGESFNFGTSGYARIAAIASTHARALVRTWQSLFGGEFGVTGGGSNSGGGFANDTTSGLTAEDAHTGHYSYKVTSSGGNPQGVGDFAYYKPSAQSEKFGVWVKDVGTRSDSRVGITSYAAYAATSPLTTVDASGADIHDGQWHYITGTIGNTLAYNNTGTVSTETGMALTVQNADGTPNTTGYFLFDDLTIVEASHPLVDAPGSAWDLMGGEGDYEQQNTLHQPAAAALDTFLQHCRQDDVNLLIEFYDCGDKVQGDRAADGRDVTTDVNGYGGDVGNMMGAYSAGPSSASDDGTETAVGLFHWQQARRWVAQFGCYVGQGVYGLAFANETPVGGGGVQWGPEHWAVQMRMQASPAADCLPPCGMDTYFNSAGSGWYASLYESPWLQFAEPHISTSGDNAGAGSYDMPFNQNPNDWLQPGVTLSRTGGPFGMGYVQYAQGAHSNPSAPGIQLPTLRTPGVWTLSCYALTTPDATGAAFAYPFSPGQFDHNVGLYLPFPGDPGYVTQCPLPASGCPTWTKLTGSIGIPASSLPWQGPTLQFVTSQPHGNVRFADIALTDPNGRVFWQFKGDEPLLDQGAGDAVAIWGEPFDASVSGEPGAGRPVVIGEAESYYLTSSLPPGSPLYSPTGPAFKTVTGPGGTASSCSTAYPMAQDALRAAAAMVDARWHPDTFWYEDSAAVDAGGYGAFFHTMQSLLDGFLAPDGSWREAPTAQSGFTGPGEPFVVYGQENSRDAVSSGAVDATKAVVSVLPVQPDPDTPHAYLPGTGLVDVQGLADAPYTVQEYDVASGRLAATLTATSAGHHLSLNFNNLAAGMVVKVSPLSAPALAVRLAVDHATAKTGDVVTYTLTYTNTGTGPALAVTVPWAVPAHMQFLSAAGGTYDSARNVVNWNLGTLAPGASGSVVLKARVQ